MADFWPSSPGGKPWFLFTVLRQLPPLVSRNSANALHCASALSSLAGRPPMSNRELIAPPPLPAASSSNAAVCSETEKFCYDVLREGLVDLLQMSSDNSLQAGFKKHREARRYHRPSRSLRR